GGALGADRPAAARREDRVAEHALDRHTAWRVAVALQEPDGAHDVVGRQRLAGEREVVELLDGRLGGLGSCLVAFAGDLVAAQVDLCAGGALDQLEPGIVAAAQRLQRFGIIEREFFASDRLGHAAPYTRLGNLLLGSFRSLSALRAVRGPESRSMSSV